MSPKDEKSRKILEKMLEEEEIHGQEAKDHGSEELFTAMIFCLLAMNLLFFQHLFKNFSTFFIFWRHFL